jgi:aerobic carbon-monoxide dehydrogenase medium subunit
VNDLPLATIDTTGESVRVGALVRHTQLEHDPTLATVAPLLARAATLIGHPAIRARGTVGGSLAHADPAAELPAALVALGGTIHTESPRGSRALPANTFFEGFFTSALAPDELVVGIDVAPAGERHGAAFREWAPRAGDFATAGVACTVELDDDGTCVRAGAAACGVAPTPVDLGATLHTAGIVGATDLPDALLRAVATAVEATVAGDDDQRTLAGLLAAAAVHDAFRAAGQPAPAENRSAA